jgi:hypothetical protein
MRTDFGAGGPWAEALTLPKDRLGFVRHECEGCHRTFKIRAARMDGLAIFRRVAGQVAHVNDHEVSGESPTRHCPYCGRQGSEESWFTEEQRTWIDQRAETFSLELRYEVLAYVERSLAANPAPTYLPVRPEQSEATLKPEPDDMRVVPLLCCRDEVKVGEGWPGPVYCYFCGTQHELGVELMRERLNKLL